MLLANFTELFLESAPWLLLGLILAGLLKVFVPMAWMQKQLGGHGFKTVVKAALLGAPLPLCSCGVIPAAVGLRRSGASKAATTSFLVSTPETGVDSITVSYVLLGPFMAIVRPIAAITSAIVAGLLVGRDDDEIVSKPLQTSINKTPTASCCSKPKEAVESFSPDTLATDATAVAASKKTSCCEAKPEASTLKVDKSLTEVPATDENKKTSCCASKSKETVATVQLPSISDIATTHKAVSTEVSCCPSKSPSETSHDHASKEEEACCVSTQDTATELKETSIIHRVGVGLHYAATDLVRDTTLWLLVGLFFAALVQTYVPGDFLAQWGDGILAMLVMVLVSVPMYICATASTPIAAGLLLAGVSPGAVLVFMLAGPATNIATLGVVVKELGKRALFGYLGGVLGVALAFGVLVNYLVKEFGFVVMPQIGEEHALLPHALVVTSGIILAILMAKVLVDKIPKKALRRDCCS
jgi:uncharacterized membrane protein YraQ (UPF0718 family)